LATSDLLNETQSTISNMDNLHFIITIQDFRGWMTRTRCFYQIPNPGTNQLELSDVTGLKDV